MTLVTCKSKLSLFVRSSMDLCPWKLGGNWAYGRLLCPGCPTHLVQKLNVGTVSRFQAEVGTRYSSTSGDY